MSGEDWGRLAYTISEWLSDDGVLGRDDPKPSFEACIKLARAFQIILNRHDNSELQRIAELEGRPVDLFKLKDMSWDEVRGIRIREFMDVAHHLMAKAEELEKVGGNVWENSYGVITLAEIQHDLVLAGAFPKARTPTPVRRGHPKAACPSVVRDIAHAIKRTMREAGYRGKLSANNEDSVTVIVGAKLIKLAFGVRFGAPGFVSAMRNRDRTRRTGTKSFFEHYPDAARITISD